jgi:hypothetical protein
MKKPIKIIITVLVLAALGFAYTERVITVNKAFADAPVTRYEVGTEVSFGDNILMDFSMKGYSVIVNHAQVLTYEEFLEKYHAEDEYTYVPEKVYDVNITLKNVDADETVGVNIMDFYIQRLAISESVDLNLYTEVNPEMNGATSIALRKNSEIEIHLPFSLWKEHYSSYTWRHLAETPIDFVATLYPEKNVVRLK